MKITPPHIVLPKFGLSRYHRLAMEGSWIVLGQIATVAGSLALVRILTEDLAPAEYGELALGLTVAGLVNQVVFGGIAQGIGRYYSIAAEAKDLQGYLHDSRSLLAYGASAAIVVGVVLMAALRWLGYSQWLGLAAATLLFSLLTGCNSALDGIQNAARQRAVVALHGGLNAWLKILLAVGVMLWLGASTTAVVIGYAFSSLLITLSQLVFLRRTIPLKSGQGARHRAWLNQIWLYSWPFSTWGIFTWMQQVSDRWSLQSFASTAEVGQYAVLFQLGYTPIAIVTGMAMSFLGPIFFQRSGDATDATRNAGVHRLAWKLMYLNVLIIVIGTLAAFAAHDWIFGILVAKEYRMFSDLFPWFVLAGGLFAAAQTLSLKLMSEMKTLAIASAKIITAIFGVALNLLGAVVAGLDGVVAALVAFSFSYFLWMVYLARKKW